MRPENVYVLPDITDIHSFSSSHGSDTYRRPILRIVEIRNRLITLYLDRKSIFRRIAAVGVLIAYLAYLIWAIVYDAEEAIPLIAATCLAGVIAVISYREEIGERLLGKGWREQIEDVVIPMKRSWNTHNWWILPIIYCSYAVFLVCYLGLVVIEKWSQLRSIGGAFIVFLISLVTSNSPKQIRWRFVLLMLIVHVSLALLIFRWSVFFNIVTWVLDLVEFVSTKGMEGGAAAFGDPWFILHPFVFIVSSLFIFVPAVFYLVYGLLRIFSPVQRIKKYIYVISDSHLHAALSSTQPFASAIPMYIFSFIGLSRRHITTGMLLTIPSGLFLCNINFPETPQGENYTEIEIMKYHRHTGNRPRAGNAYALIFKAAVYMVTITVKCYAIILAFGSILIFFDHVVIWFGHGVGLDITIPKLLGYILMPLTYMLGTAWEDSDLVAYLAGNKCLGISLKSMLRLAYLNAGNKLQRETLAIVTHATLGFSYFGTLAIYAGAVSILCPNQLSRIFSIFPRLMFNACMSCFFTAGVAHTITPDSFYEEADKESFLPLMYPILWVLDSLPGYKQLMSLVSFE